MRLFAPAAAALVLACVTASAGLGSVPAGPTARCRDGTPSYAVHHSGACSHHGGVAVWLDGTTGSGGSHSTAAVGAVKVGSTVLLGRRSRSTGCKLGPNPD